jgi:hypothetical protein
LYGKAFQRFAVVNKLAALLENRLGCAARFEADLPGPSSRQADDLNSSISPLESLAAINLAPLMAMIKSENLSHRAQRSGGRRCLRIRKKMGVGKVKQPTKHPCSRGADPKRSLQICGVERKS